MASDFQTGFEIKLGILTGCVMLEDHPFAVETIAEARSAILQYAIDALGHHAHDPDKREHLRLNVPAGGPTWDDLAECEEGRHYDPADPDTGMTCSYYLFGQGGLEGVGGVTWIYGVTIWATAPPKYGTTPPTNPPHSTVLTTATTIWSSTRTSNHSISRAA